MQKTPGRKTRVGCRPDGATGATATAGNHSSKITTGTSGASRGASTGANASTGASASTSGSMSAALGDMQAAAARHAAHVAARPLHYPLHLRTMCLMEFCDGGSLQDAVDRGWLRKGACSPCSPPDIPKVMGCLLACSKPNFVVGWR